MEFIFVITISELVDCHTTLKECLFCKYFLNCYVFRRHHPASHQPPKEPAGPAAVPSGPLPPLQSGHVHHHLPQTLPPA